MLWFYLLVLAFPVTVIITRTEAGDFLLVRPVSWLLRNRKLVDGWTYVCSCCTCAGFWIVLSLACYFHASIIDGAIAYSILMYACALYDTLTQRQLPEW